MIYIESELRAASFVLSNWPMEMEINANGEQPPDKDSKSILNRSQRTRITSIVSFDTFLKFKLWL